jgi:hypothetical protein
MERSGTCIEKPQNWLVGNEGLTLLGSKMEKSYANSDFRSVL